MPLRRTAILFGLLLTAGQAASAQAPGLSAGPMIGSTTHEGAAIWARGEVPGSFVVRVRPEGDEGPPPRQFGPATFDAARDLTAVVRVTGLAPSTAWTYQVIVSPEGKGPLEPGSSWGLRTLPKPGEGKVRIAFGSCLKVSFSPEQPVFAPIAAAAPDVFLWLGDNCYYTEGDLQDPTRLWGRMRQARSLPSLRALLASTPQLAQWDDHDYGDNNSDRRFRYKRESRDVFAAYWPNPSAGEDGQGIYTRCDLGPVDLFLLDNRWYRDPARQKDGPEKGILGARQRAWLLAGLAASRAPIKLIATGSQFLSRYHRWESWDKARHERTALLAAIAEKKIKGVVLVSGDRHLAEVQRWDSSHVGYPLWEVTASPLSNRFFPDGEQLENPDREFVYGQGPNFGWIEVDAETKTLVLELRDASGKTIWRKAPTGIWPEAE